MIHPVYIGLINKGKEGKHVHERDNTCGKWSKGWISLFTLLVFMYFVPALIAADSERTSMNMLQFKTGDQICSALLIGPPEDNRPYIPAISLYLSFRGTMLTNESEPQLEELFAALGNEELRGYIFEIAGHTCNLGPESLSQKLSEQRARAVKDWLVSRGLSEARFIVTGYGGRKPIAENTTEEGRRINRRIEIRTLGIGVAEAQRPSVKEGEKKEGVTMEVPRSMKYSTSLLEEGIRLYREGRFHEAVVIFEKSLEDFRRQAFEDGEIAALGNLYLACLAAGYEKKAFDYLDEYRKKRRKK